ncbi:MAG TPA: hypothetical protein VKB25_04885 [Conexibacter sp.]|nr:hypothetical protein [Conexibacter sp.]
MPTRRPDNVRRGSLAEALRARTVRAKNTDPAEVAASFDRIARLADSLRLGPGANTVRRRGRY